MTAHWCSSPLSCLMMHGKQADPMKRTCAIILVLVLVLMGGCGKKAPADGIYAVDVTLTGGSGRAGIDSAQVSIQGSDVTATIVWSSPYYEYMIVDGIRYEPVQTSGNATFTFPVVMDEEMKVSACTVAMSQPHLIDYTLFFDSGSLKGE